MDDSSPRFRDDASDRRLCDLPPELYPTRLRSSGVGFTYNAGRIIAALGPFLAGNP